MNRKSSTLIAAAALAALGSSFARAQTVDGIMSPGEYTNTLALQGTQTGFGNNASELDGMYGGYNVGTGALNLMVTGNVEGNSNGFVLFMDTRSGGAVRSTAGGGFNQFGSISGRYSDDWGTDIDGGTGVSTNHTPSVVNPGFNPNYALGVEHYGPNNQYYIHVIDLRLDNTPGNEDGINPAGAQANRDLFLGLGTPGGGGTTSTYTRYGPTDVWGTPTVASGTVQHAFNNSNVDGVNGSDDPTLGDPTTATTGVEYAFDSTFLNHEPGHAVRVMAFITNNDGGYLSNQFLPKVHYADSGNLGGLGDWGGPGLADQRNDAFSGDMSITLFEPSFTAGGDNKWSTPGNWAGNFAPNGVEHDAAFRNGLGVVDLDESVTLGTLTFQHDADANGYHIQTTNSSTITMNAGLGAALIDVVSGSHAISADVSFATDTRIRGGLADLTFFGTTHNLGKTVTVAGGTINFNAQSNSAGSILVADGGNVNLNGNGGTNLSVYSNAGIHINANNALKTIGVNGGGYLDVNNSAVVSTTDAMYNSGTLVVNSGSLSSGGALTGGGNMTVAAGATVTAHKYVQRSMTVNGVATVRTRANGGGVSVVNSLTLGANGHLDLNDNDLVVQYGTNANSFNDIYNAVINGFVGSDNGTIISTEGRNNPNANTIHYMVDNGLVGLTEWPIGSGNSIDTNSVIAKYTYFGDVNFSGAVDDSDYAVLDGNYGATVTPDTGVLLGDANLSGTVDDSDYAVLDGNYGNGVGNPLSPASMQSVPEPASIAMLAAGAGLLGLRRRRARANA